MKKLKIGRNDPCTCGSGKKYKKCCLNKIDYSSDPSYSSGSSYSSAPPSYSFYSSDASSPYVYLSSYEITSEPINSSEEYVALEESDSIKLDYMGSEIIEKNFKNLDDKILFLEDLIKRHPRLRRAYNLLSISYQKNSDTDKLKEIIERTYHHFPDYLFAKTSYVNLQMNDGNYNAFEEVFDGKFDLPMLYPERKVFHISEVVAMYTVSCQYYINTKNFENAEMYLNILEQLNFEDQVVESLRIRLSSAIMKTELPNQKDMTSVLRLFRSLRRFSNKKVQAWRKKTPSLDSKSPM